MDKKKLIILISGLLTILIIITGALFVLGKNKISLVSPLSFGSPKVSSEKEIKLLTYKDSAGFQFDYPENLKIEDVTGDDPSLYSFLELLSPGSSEKMKIKVADTSLNSITEWFETKEASGAGNQRDLILADMPAKQIQFNDSQRLLTLSIAEGIIYLIESPLDLTWNKIHNQIVTSFQFEPTSASTSDEGEGAIYEEEEVIE